MKWLFLASLLSLYHQPSVVALEKISLELIQVVLPEESPPSAIRFSTSAIPYDEASIPHARICIKIRENIGFSLRSSVANDVGCRGYWGDFKSREYAEIVVDEGRRMYDHRGDYTIFAWLTDGKGGEGSGQQDNVISDVAELNVSIHMPRKVSQCPESESKSEEDQKKTAIIFVSISNPTVANLSRPWVPTTEDRIRKYASRTSSSVITVRETAHCHHLTKPGRRPHKDQATAQRDCSMRAKLDAMKQGLENFDRVLLVDDTVLIRGDTPDLFSLVPEDMIGAALQTDEIFGEETNDEQMRSMQDFYGVDEGEGGNRRDDRQDGGNRRQVFNSGVMVLTSSHHLPMFSELDGGVETRSDLFGDQGYLNAMAARHGVGVFDVGYKYNFVGSFETYNVHQITLRKYDAYIVHATTGLLSKFVEIEGRVYLTQMEGQEATDFRTEYINDIDKEWKMRGL